jgi:hypothetical protein
VNDSFEVEQQLQAELDSGENIVWETLAKPVYFAAKAIFPAVFAVAWVAIISLSMSTSFKRHSGPQDYIPFVFFGFVLVLMMGLPLLRLLSRQNTYYLITNRRALIITLGRTKKVVSYYAAKLQSLERRERPDGSGDIVFERAMIANPWGGASRGSSYSQEVGFMNIPEVKNVEGMLRDLARKP